MLCLGPYLWYVFFVLVCVFCLDGMCFSSSSVFFVLMVCVFRLRVFLLSYSVSWSGS